MLNNNNNLINFPPIQNNLLNSSFTFGKSNSNNLPMNNLHSDMNSDIKIIQDNEDTERKRVIYLAKQYLKNYSSKEEMLQQFEKIEPFCEYIEDIKNNC